MTRLLGTVLIACAALSMGLASRANAQDTRADGLRVRPTVSAGFVWAGVGYDFYAFAPTLHAGADVLFENEPAHELVLTAGYAAWALRGARLDLVTAEGGWRCRPAPELGFYFALTGGLALLREDFDARIGGQRIDAETFSPGGIASASVGWTIFEYVDLELSYRHALLATGSGASSLGTVGASLGGRL